MIQVIFCGFGENQDKRVFAKSGDLLLRVAKDNGVKIITECEDGNCASCAVKVEELTAEKQTHYMEDKELATLISISALSKGEAERLQQDTVGHTVRLACQCILKGDVLVKPYKLQ
jgi:ferredoxin